MSSDAPDPRRFPGHFSSGKPVTHADLPTVSGRPAVGASPATSAVDVPALLVAAVRNEVTDRARVIALLRALAGPARGRDNHVLMTGNILHALADLTEELEP